MRGGTEEIQGPPSMACNYGIRLRSFVEVVNGHLYAPHLKVFALEA